MRNPFGFNTKQFIETAGFAIVGGVGARALPQYAAPNYNSGLVGYAMNAAATAVIAYLSGMYTKEAGLGAAIGGTVMTVGRIVSDYFGKQLVTFSLLDPTTATASPVAAANVSTPSLSGLRQGDLHFDLRGYKQSYFDIPSNTDPKTLTVAKPWGSDLAKLQAQLMAKSKAGASGSHASGGSRPTKATAMSGGRYALTM